MNLISLRRVCAPKFIVALAVGAAALATAHNASAQYGTDFNGFTTGETVSGQDDWTTNDPYTGASITYTPNGSTTAVTRDIGQSEGVQVVDNYSANQNDNLALFGGAFNTSGGALPGHGTVTLTHAANLPATGSIAVFSTDYVVTTPGTVHPSHDSFGFVFQNAASDPLFSVNFVQTSQNLTTNDNITITSGTTTTVPLSSFTLGSRYQLSLSINRTNSTFNVFVQPESLTGALSGTATKLNANPIAFTGTIASAGAFWTLADNTTAPATAGASTDGTGNDNAYTNAGGNTMFFDNFSIVPEPSTYVMIGLGLVGLAVTAKRRTRLA